MKRALRYVWAVFIGTVGGELGGLFLGAWYEIYLYNFFGTWFGAYCAIKFADWWFKFKRLKTALIIGSIAAVAHFVGNSVLFFNHNGLEGLWKPIALVAFNLAVCSLGIYSGYRALRSDIKHNIDRTKWGRNPL